MLWVLSAVIGLLIGAAGAWIIQASARKKDAALAEADLKVAQSRAQMLEDSLAEQKEARKAEVEAMRREYDERLQKIVLTFKDSASAILKEKSQDLSAANSEQIKNILDPLGRKMEEFRRAVEESKEKSLKNSASIEQQIRSMMEQTADNLATALRSNNKAVGNWGEVILLNLLEGMGLQEGMDYVQQETIKDMDGRTVLSDESGRRLVPDVVLYLPENKAVVIDSKVSLDGYIDYSNSTDDTGRAVALASHRRSVEAHVKELSDKNYSQYIRQTGRDSLDYVVMFMPNEGAFQLYYHIITGESNLFAMLKIIENTWIRVNQQKNTEEVMRLASELLDRVGKFANTFDDMGVVLGKATAKFEEARRVLSGRVSVVSTARKLEKKGVQVKASFHAALLGESIEDDSDAENNVNKDNQ